MNSKDSIRGNKFENYSEQIKSYDCLRLLENLKLLSSGIDSKQNSAYTISETVFSIYHIRQQQYEGFNSYHKKFVSIVKIAKLMGINYDVHDQIIESQKNYIRVKAMMKYIREHRIGTRS